MLPWQGGFAVIAEVVGELAFQGGLDQPLGQLGEQPTLAIRAGVALDVLADTIQPFPTFSEIYLAAVKALRREITASREPAPGA